MRVGDVILISGCVTKEKFIAGRTLLEIEKVLGFHTGRLSRGVAIAVLTELPEAGQFEMAAYSNIASHRYKTPERLDIDKLKAIARATWAETGFERLAKVFPGIRHDGALNPDIQYPPGYGAPQWVMKAQLRGKVVAVIDDYPNGRYLPTRR